MEYKVLNHSSIKFITDNSNIYFDPFCIKNNSNDADIIFITHSHFDHFSKEDIDKIINENTVIVMPKSVDGSMYKNVFYVESCEDYTIKNIKFHTVKSYNKNKDFHKESDGFLGYVLSIDDKKYYVMGDTDTNDDVLNVKAEYIFIPIGGKFTFDYVEASEYINKVKPKVAIATHFTYSDIKEKCVDEFRKLVSKDIVVEK